MSRRAGVFESVFERQNRIKNGRVMPILSWRKSGVLAYFEPKFSHFGHIFEIWTSNLFGPSFPLILNGKPSWK